MSFDITDDADADRLSHYCQMVYRRKSLEPDVQPGPLSGVPPKLNLQQ